MLDQTACIVTSPQVKTQKVPGTAAQPERPEMPGPTSQSQGNISILTDLFDVGFRKSRKAPAYEGGLQVSQVSQVSAILAGLGARHIESCSAAA